MLEIFETSASQIFGHACCQDQRICSFKVMSSCSNGTLEKLTCTEIKLNSTKTIEMNLMTIKYSCIADSSLPHFYFVKLNN